MKRSSYCTIRRSPTETDLKRLMNVARSTVEEIAKMDGALGADAISLLYVERIYSAVVDGAVKAKGKPA